MSTPKVDVGFLEEQENWLLHPKFFPSKVGGKPAWLDLRNLPTPNNLICKKCNDPLVFLCQIYAPYEEKNDGFHRTVFIFVCKNGPCCQPNVADNFLVLRCQLPRQNDFYSFEPCQEDKSLDFPMDNWPKLCEICGCKAPSHCSKCKKTFYCHRKHQVLDWQKGHKEKCPTLQDSNVHVSSYFQTTQAGKSVLFKEWELSVDEEDGPDPDKHVDENKEMETLRKMMLEKRAGTLDNVSEAELEQYTKTAPEDKVFNKFTKRVNRHPDQVLRYERGGQPLWITGNPDNVPEVPNCPHCNGERQFEFQIMPQLLNFIDVGIDFNSIDWGVLVVYTCKESCNTGPAYKEEFLIKQDVV